MASRKAYPGSIDQRPSGTWRWRGSIDGERVRETWKPDEVEAANRPHESRRQTVERLAREHYDEITGDRYREESGEMALSVFLDRFESEEIPQLADGSETQYRAAVNALRSYFVELRNDCRLEDVSKGDVKRFLRWRRTHASDGRKRDEPISDYTLASNYAIFRRVMGDAHELELIPGNPVIRIDTPEIEDREPVILDEDQYEELLEKCSGDDMLHLYVLILGEAGLRSRSEAPWIRWEDLDLEGGFLRVVSGQHGRDTKSGKGRWVPMTSRVREALRDHAATYRLQTYGGERSPWVLHHLRRNRWAEPGDRRKNFRNALTTAIEKAGLPEEFRPHDLRHRRCTRWLSQGHSTEKVRRAMGHADTSTTLKYSHLVRGDLETMVERDEREDLEGMKGGP